MAGRFDRAQKTPFLPNEFGQMVRQRTSQAGGVALILLAALLAMAVLSYSPHDPSFNRVGDGPVSNLLGQSGAHTADLILQTIGLAGFTFSAAFAAWGWQATGGGLPGALWLRIAGLATGTLLLAQALSTLPPPESWPLNTGLGGFAGALLLKKFAGFATALFGALGVAAVGLVSAVGAAASLAYALNLKARDYSGAARTAGQLAGQIGHVGVSGAARAARGFLDEARREWATRRSVRGNDGLSVQADGYAHPAHLRHPAPAAGRNGWRRSESMHSAATGPNRGNTHPDIWAEIDPLDEEITPFVPSTPPLAADFAGWREHDEHGAPPSLDEPDDAAPPARRRAASPDAYTPPPSPMDAGAVPGLRDHGPVEIFTSDSTEIPAATRDSGGWVYRPHPDYRGSLGPICSAEPVDRTGEAVDVDAGTTVLATKVNGESIWTDASDGVEPDGYVEEDLLRTPPTPVYEDELNIPAPTAVARATPPSMPRAMPEAQDGVMLRGAASGCAAPVNDAPPRRFAMPSLELLTSAPKPVMPDWANNDMLEERARKLEAVLQDFGVRGKIVNIRPGPVVTLYELEPSPGTKTSRVIGLSDDIARSMSAVSVRIAVVPGRNVIGVELPNPKREMVHLRPLLCRPDYREDSVNLPLVLGKDIGGEPVVADLACMPHLLVAGTTGSGKSVAVNTMILSILYRMGPDVCRFIMIDPKMLELSVYNDIPHLLTPVVTDPSKAVVALKWAVREMEDRYRKMSMLGVRNIASYNQRVGEARRKGEMLTRRVQTGFDADTGKPVYEDQPLPLGPLPYIVVVVDEMADLMLVAGKDIEAAIQRLAQMARAAGIHLIMATQRPSVDVITGTIKANFPTRISFQVTSKIDSRTILGEQGAEALLGQGDMLYMAGGGRITRVHGPFVSDKEVEQVVGHLKTQAAPEYIHAITEDVEEVGGAGGAAAGGGNAAADALYDEAVALVARERKASTSFIQRHLQIGYNRAARIIETMEAEGIVSAANHVGKREVLTRKLEEAV